MGLLLLSSRLQFEPHHVLSEDYGHLHLVLFNECLTPANLEAEYLPHALLFCFSLEGPAKHLPTVSLPSLNRPGTLVPLHCTRMDMSPAAVLAF